MRASSLLCSTRSFVPMLSPSPTSFNLSNLSVDLSLSVFVRLRPGYLITPPLSAIVIPIGPLARSRAPRIHCSRPRLPSFLYRRATVFLGRRGKSPVRFAPFVGSAWLSFATGDPATVQFPSLFFRGVFKDSGSSWVFWASLLCPVVFSFLVHFTRRF